MPKSMKAVIFLDNNSSKPVFCYLHTLTMWRCPLLPTVRCCCSTQYLLPARPTAANRQQRVCRCRRMDIVTFHRLCSAHYPGSASNLVTCFECPVSALMKLIKIKKEHITHNRYHYNNQSRLFFVSPDLTC